MDSSTAANSFLGEGRLPWSGAATGFVLAVHGTAREWYRYSGHEKLILAYIHFWPGTILSKKFRAFFSQYFATAY
jgi:hypothetical protein